MALESTFVPPYRGEVIIPPAALLWRHTQGQMSLLGIIFFLRQTAGSWMVCISHVLGAPRMVGQAAGIAPGALYSGISSRKIRHWRSAGPLLALRNRDQALILFASLARHSVT